MKTILIAYDGSACAEVIFAELQRAGLPPQLHAHVVSVAEEWALPVPAPTSWAEALEIPTAAPSEAEAMRRAESLAEAGAARVRALFPAWEVVPFGSVGSAARVLQQRANDVSAAVIFIGSHSRSAVGRFFLGSVSQKVATEAKCSVRICRPTVRLGASPRLLVAVDGSRHSQVAVRALADRSWPAGTTVAVVNVIEPAIRVVPESRPEYAAEVRRQHDARLDWLQTVTAAAQHHLERAALSVECHSLEGEPKSTLLEWAERWEADCIFVGASGLHHPATGTLGTVASALAVRAHCSVEIVRP